MKRKISLQMHCLSFTIVCIGLEAQLARRSKVKSLHRGFTALVALGLRFPGIGTGMQHVSLY